MPDAVGVGVGQLLSITKQPAVCPSGGKTKKIHTNLTFIAGILARRTRAVELDLTNTADVVFG